MTPRRAPRLLPLSNPRSRAFREAYAIYEATIPKAERKTRRQLLAALRKPAFRFWAFEVDGRIAGFASLYASGALNLVLLEYLAIAPAFQGRGLGSALFEVAVAASRFDRRTRVLVEVDSEREKTSAAERRLRLGRKQFYRRLSCREIEGIEYLLPLETYGPAPRMNLLVRSADKAALPATWLAQALTDIYVNVYGQAPDDPRLARMMAGQGPRLVLK
mgnify:CR=1 FL=1